MLHATHYMSKKNIILGIILVVLVAFAWAWTGPLKNLQAKKNQEKNFLAGISAVQINKVIINNGGKTVELDKNGDTWMIAGEKKFSIDKEAVSGLNSVLSQVGTLPVEAISTNADKKSFFGTDDKGLKVEVSQNGANFNFVVGKATTDNSGTYLSSPDAGITYRIALDLNSVFGRAEWRDSSVFSFIPERSNKLRFQYPAQQFTVEKISNKWAGTKPYKFNVADEKVGAVLSVLASLKAAKIPAQTFANTGLEKHSFILQDTGEGFDNTLMVGNCTGDNLCYAKTAASDNIYLIKKSEFDALAKKMADLK
jgi:hypothetical protein